MVLKWLKSKKTEKDAEVREKELAAIEKAASNINGRAHIREAKKLISIVPSHIKKVAVLVKPENSFAEKINDLFDYFQDKLIIQM